MKIEKVEKVVANLHDKTEYAIHRRISKQAFFVYMKSDLRKKAKSDFEKKLVVKFMNNAIFGKSVENVRT